MFKKVVLAIASIAVLAGCSMNNPFLPTDDKLPEIEKVLLNNATIDIGDTLQLIPTIEPDYIEDKSLTWSSSDTEYVTVDQSGKITGIRRYADESKYAVITATASNGVKGTCRVYVIGDPKFELDDLNLLAGESKSLTLKCTTTKGNIESTEWTISKTDIAEITSSVNASDTSTAIINGLKAGIAIINIKIKLENDDSTYWTNCILTVTKNAEIESITLNNATIDIGDTLQLIPTILPSDAADKSLTWSSSDTEYVTVDQSGKITGIKRYADKSKYAVITATASNGVKGSCRVYVIGDPVFTINDAEIFMKETAALELTCTTAKGNISDAKWTVSNDKLAELSNESFSVNRAAANITGIKAGTVNVNIEIKLENDDSTYYASCNVVIKPKYTIILTATEGASYYWMQNGKTTRELQIEVTENTTFQCRITNPGGLYDTGNLLTAGSFEFEPNNPIRSEKNKLGDTISYEYMNMNNDGKNMPIGSVTTATNAKNVKPLYFADLGAQEGNRLLVCDGGNSSSARVWTARNLKLKGGITYQFSCWAANIDLEYEKHGKNSLAKLKFVIENSEAPSNTLLEFTVPEELGEWKEYTSTYTPSKDLDWCHIFIVNYTTVDEGNDFAIDNIYFGTVQNTNATEILETFTIDISQDPPLIKKSSVKQ